MPSLHDTQPSKSLTYRRHYESGLRRPPRLLFWGVILFFFLVVFGIAGAIFGFREILRPAQQQRVIDQLPFMRAFRDPTPMGGVFPTLAAPVDVDAALALLEQPLAISSPTSESAENSGALAATDTPVPASPTPTAMPATATALPSPTALPATAVPAASPTDSLPASARIHGLRHQQQTWNNCGPATITMALSYYGWQRDQAFAASLLKPNREDKNVSPQELAAFVNEQSNVKAIVRLGGTLNLLKRLAANGFPVVIETGAMFEAYEWIGHYRVLVAYDDAYQLFYFFDSFLGVGDAAQGISETYERVDSDWAAFNRSFIVIYEPQRESLLRALMAEHWQAESAAQIAFETAQLEARREPQNAFAWFNMGSSLVALGRYQEAATAFDQANSTGKLPWRMHWYQFGAFEAYFQVGRYDDVLSLVKINQNSAPELEEIYYWRGRVQEARGAPQQAAASYRRALGYNQHYAAAQAALNQLNA